MTAEQKEEWASLEERHTHSDTMVFSDLDHAHLREYQALAERLKHEAAKEVQL
ncbi:hypothetical protein ACTXK7_07335 [Vreelandella alkaliphila]|uniref:hypothetical protein n=1 Tax=Halomonadaceae TaxID=28256 RepID=UPI003F8F756F